MSHCPGCGGHYEQGQHKNFMHLLGCGWIYDKPEEGRKAPSKKAKQNSIVTIGLEAAEVARKNNEDETAAFVDAVLEELDAYQKT